MKDIIDKIAKRVANKIINEEALKPGMEFRTPFSEVKGKMMLAKKYGVSPEDFDYFGGGLFVYKSKSKTRSGTTKKKKQPAIIKQNKHLGRQEGETEQDYLERVRQVNKHYADEESAIEGELWRPVVNNGRYRGGNTDYTRSHEVSNMGRIRRIDYDDPMRSHISYGYDVPTRGARQYHLDTMGDSDEWEKTTPPIHTIVADAWLEPPEGDIRDYDVEHIDGNYHNNRADNLRYVLRKGRRGKKKNNIEHNGEENMNNNVTESRLRRIIRESVKRVLKEGTTEMSDIEKWDELKEMMGSDQMLDAIFQYLDSDQISDILEELDAQTDYSYFKGGY